MGSVLENNKYLELYNSIQCGIFEYITMPDKVRFLDINRMGMEIFGYTSNEFWSKDTWTLDEIVYAPDIPVIEAMVSDLKEIGDESEYTYRLLRKGGIPLWVSGNLKVVDIVEEGMVLQSVCLDIDKRKQAEAELMAEREKMAIVLDNSDITLWDYDPETRVCTRRSGFRNPFGTPLSTTPEEMINRGEVHPDSIKECLNIFDAIDSGGDFYSGEVRLSDRNGTSRWVRMSIKRIDDGNGDLMIIGWSVDITKTKAEQEMLREEIRHQEAADADNLLSKARINLTENVIETYIADDDVSITGTSAGTIYDMAVEGLLKTCVTERHRTALKNIMGRSNAERNFREGRNSAEVEYRRKIKDGRMIWVKTIIRIYMDSISGCLMSFLYTYNIDEEKVMQTIVYKSSKDVSEMMGLIYTDIDLLHIIHAKFEKYRGHEMTYSDSVDKYVSDMIAGDCIEEAMEAFSLDSIKKALDEKERYTFAYPVNYGDTSGRKKWEFYYADETKVCVIVNRTDITELFEQQERQREALEAALLAAKQASSAKSNFLSRMSHEIRTPMNAILGMCTLAAQSVGNDEEVSDCISKIGISGHYLLNLINDILDMSRIESGKMLLQHENFRMEELVSSINTIIYGQAEAKNLDYETIIDSNVEESYDGDAMKLQQVLVNILGNAVKFTAPGGRITFSIHVGKIDYKSQKVIFTINDTGCGIKEEDIRRIFDPFEQIDNSNTTEYGGTGLGLAIAQNLTQLMGGTIQCRSIVDVGTEFTVQIPLDVGINVKRTSVQPIQFSRMNTLIVDDDIVVCESTSRILREIGMIPHWVTSGMSAIEKVQEWYEKKKNFDYILIDWKMPDMDGIETTRRIRKILGMDVTIIMITSYDWVQIDSEARQAGANMCISKPMFRSTLISAFENAGNRASAGTEAAEEDYDFTGIRLLLVEDHHMNAEIATRLLKSKNCEVELAENGLKALERFTTTPVDYYDAILMDIRMPIMDGLQASMNIRRWDKADSKTIPIIAMTANAFDEDVEKCRAAGMNAHLAKPIEPQLMYQTLYRVLKADGKIRNCPAKD